VIDVAEPQFFTLDSNRRESSAKEALEFYYDHTPAQEVSAYINYGLESKFAFLEERKFSLNKLLSDISLPNRPGVFVFPNFPKEFEVTTHERQTFMTKEFLADTALQNRQKNIWKGFMVTNAGKVPAMHGTELETFLSQIKKYIDRIKARGGEVVFVRPPSSGLLLEVENKYYPTNTHWDVLLKYTNTPGVHFADYPVIANFVCPEWSHLSTVDAITFTETLVSALQEKAGWTFPNVKTSVSANQKP
jgi:hypothetical protein